MAEDEPGAAYWSAVEPVWGLIDIYHGEQRFLESYAAAEARAATLFAVHFCQSEVRNGGFAQFFSNPTGVLVPEAVQGFRRLGMQDAAELLEKAMGYFGLAYPRERAVREALLGLRSADHDGDDGPFEELDDAFFDALDGDGDRFERAADDYARARPPAAG